MANTFTLISTITVGSGGAASIDFTSIPSTYTDLCLKVSGRSSAGPSGGTEFYTKFNANTSSYSSKLLFGAGSSTGSLSGSSTQYNLAIMCANGDTASTFGNAEFYIPNYAGSNYKSVSVDSVNENNATAAYVYLTAGLWSNTAAINQITLTPYSGNFVQYSSASLYGILKA